MRPDVNNFQYFLLQQRDSVLSVANLFDGTPIVDWSAPPVFSYEPKLKPGDFWGFELLGSTFVAAPAMVTPVRRLLAEAGQILPLRYEGEVFGLLNVTECVECLDSDRTKWIFGETTGKPIRIAQYAFHRDRLPESSLFKIPQTARSEILCYEGLKDPNDEFKAVVERSGLTGISFQELWGDDRD